MKTVAHRFEATPRTAGPESGMALVLALMALMILTVVGLTLAATTSTEVQVAANFRWSKMALYNAEAGLAVAKAEIDAQLGTATDFVTLLPPRGVTTMWPLNGTPSGPASITPPATSSRNFENWQCDRRGNGMGNGVVIPTTAGTALADQQAWGGQSLNGFFTVWMRRPVVIDVDATDNSAKLRDYQGAGDPAVTGNFPSGDTMILLAEGVAPAVAAGGSRAVQYMEVTGYPYLEENAVPPCGSLGAQVGKGPANHNVSCLGQSWGTPMGGGRPPGLDPRWGAI